VNWFNAVDATYRSDLRELNELNFARFDAKLEQRFAQFEAKLEQRIGNIERGTAQLETRLIRWMFAFWAPTALATVGTALGVVSLLLRR
jgi:CRP-like cAMP-binding protein